MFRIAILDNLKDFLDRLYRFIGIGFIKIQLILDN